MRFFLVDDDDAIRYMLTEIIEDYDLGRVVGESDNGANIDADLLILKKVDILIIDMLMPIRDGIQTVKEIKDHFQGKIIMLSQVENKEMVGKAYSLGVDAYITKPINRNEVVSVIKTTSEHINLKKLFHNIETSLNTALRPVHTDTAPKSSRALRDKQLASAQAVLSDMGIAGEKGCQDLLNIIDFLYDYEQNNTEQKDFPVLKFIFTSIAEKKLGLENELDVQKECKALEQRLRRTIFQALVNLASMGVIDYANPKFEDYAAKFFDFAEVRKIMMCLENEERPNMSQSHINLKKFIKVLFMESKKA